MSSLGPGFRRDKVLPYFLSALPNCFSVSYYFESLIFFSFQILLNLIGEMNSFCMFISNWF